MSTLVLVAVYCVGVVAGWFARAYVTKHQAAETSTEKPKGGGGHGEE